MGRLLIGLSHVVVSHFIKGTEGWERDCTHTKQTVFIVRSIFMP